MRIATSPRNDTVGARISARASPFLVGDGALDVPFLVPRRGKAKRKTPQSGLRPDSSPFGRGAYMEGDCNATI